MDLPTVKETIEDIKVLKKELPKLVKRYIEVTEKHIKSGEYTKEEAAAIRKAYK